jgi:ABC-type transport system substrate-binding protein
MEAEMQNYWQRVLTTRTSRRRALAATGATAASAAFLAACGGDEGSGGNGGTKDTSGLVYTPEDETKSAKHGGRHISVQSNGLVTHDPHRIGAHGIMAARVYSQLFRIKDGHLANTSGEIMGDLVESWELSPDKLTLTVKIDPGAGFGPQEPVNGRQANAEDVIFSWNRVESMGTLRGDLSNKASPQAPIVSMAATDARTVTIKMAEPNAMIYSLLGHNGLGSLWIIPKDAEDEARLDIARNPRGSGPYYLTESSEVNMRFLKNPNFKRASLKNNEPYIEEIFEPVITDTATISAQFRAGQVYEATIPPTEIVDAKRNNMNLLMFSDDPIPTERVYFGYNEGSPFIDERLRKAYYKCIDRDLYIQAAYNTDRFAADGLEVEEIWEGSFGANSWRGWLLDPKSTKDYGDVQKNFEVDIAEAKKLVEAAGHKTPFEYQQVQSAPGPTSFARPIYDRKDVWEGMIRDSGVFAPVIKDLEWATEWSPQIRQSKGKFVGASWGPDTSSFDPSFAAFFIYNPAGGYYEGGDQTLDDLTLKIRAEFDEEKRKDLVRQVQRYDAEKMFNQKLGVAASLALIWPIVRNVQVFRGGTNWRDLRRTSGLNAWLDTSKPPLGRV